MRLHGAWCLITDMDDCQCVGIVLKLRAQCRSSTYGCEPSAQFCLSLVVSRTAVNHRAMESAAYRGKVDNLIASVSQMH
jgi:hypothetical protein